MSQTIHYSVLLQESLDGLAIHPSGIYIDCTFGRGGHSQAILKQLGEEGQLMAIDQDPVAIKFAQQTIQDSRFQIQHGSFEQLEDFCRDRGWLGKVNGILLDLGVSSPQLDEADRGFSFMREGPLDMRMDTSQGLTAKQWLTKVDQEELKRVLKVYGEERFSGRIARHIKEAISAGELNTTKDLAELVSKASPKVDKHKHPATRTFQAIRIAVNRELDVLEKVLASAVKVLAPKGRLSVISFHSLEDRIVKVFMRDNSKQQDLYPDSPIPMGVIEPVIKRIGKPVFPSQQECSENSRSRSSVLRIAEKL